MLLLILKKKSLRIWMHLHKNQPFTWLTVSWLTNDLMTAPNTDISLWRSGCRFIKRPYEKLSCPRISFVNSEDTRGEWTRWKCQGTKDFATKDTLVCFLLSESQLHTFTQEASMKSVQDTIHGKIIVSLLF